MCGIGGILRIVRPGDPDYPPDPADPRLAPSGAWLWQGDDPRDLAYSRVSSDESPHAGDEASSTNPRVARRTSTSPGPSFLIPEAWLDALDEGIQWRGPDGAGRFRDRVVRADGTIVEVALVHRRLAIIDLASGGQPMVVTRCPRCAERARQSRDRKGATSNSDGIRPLPTTAGLQPHGRGSEPTPLAAVVFNGCIYNHRELRAELEAKGHIFATNHADTEVILHAIREDPEQANPDANEEWSPSQVRPEGMYAYAFWDRNEDGWLFVNRDPRGEKPLYNESIESRRISVFASSLAAVSECLSLIGYESTRWDKYHWMHPQHSIADWVAFGWSTDDLLTGDVRECDRYPTTISWFEDLDARSRLVKARDNLLVLVAAIVFVGVLLAILLGLIALGHYVIAALVGLLGSTGLASLLIKLPVPWAAGAIYKSIRAQGTTPGIEDRFDALLDEAVLSRLDSDVPLGCFLSGGVDSSLIAHYAQRHLGNLTTLTVRMPDERYDESAHAELVARRLGTEHITLDCNADSAADDLVRIIETLGLPFGDSSILPTYWLCRAARKHVKVALAGDGGDELFFGYDRYKAMKYLGWRRWALRMLSAKGLDRSDPKSPDDRKVRLITAAKHLGYVELVSIFPTPDRAALLGGRAGSVCRKGVWGGVQAARQWDLDHYLPGDLLRKVDTASMMCGVEVRCPYLAPAVADFALGISPRAHMKGGETKHLLKELARMHLPREVIDRPKQGFAIPISDWWRTNFGGLQDLLLDMLAGDRPFGFVHDVLNVNMAFVRQMLDEHWAAGGLTPMHTTRHVRLRDHGQRLFALATLAIWARTLEKEIHHRDTESTERAI